jgi:hypothetical protein
MDWLLSPASFYPTLSPEMQAFIRMGYAVILLLTLLISLPNRRFFLSERWGGYAKSAPDVDWIQNPIAYPVVQLLWFGLGIAIFLGYWSVWAALLNMLLCRYFFVYMRWKGVARGMGAPGYMTYWMGLGVFLLEFTSTYAPHYRQLAILVIQVDLALVMFSAGFYKLNAGYAHNNGMELGAANPEWGFWPKFYSNRNPDHWTMQMFNQLAWITEVAAAVLMIVSPLRFIGGLLIFFSFAFLVSQIRLGWLAWLVMLCAMIFFHEGSLADQLIQAVLPMSSVQAHNPQLTVPNLVNDLLAAFIWAYLLLLPFAHLGLFYNFYMQKQFPGMLQPLLERYTNFFGLIIWRVFSQDHVNFYIMIYQQAKTGGPRTLITNYGWQGGGFLNRYNHVGESITITTLFTTLKYYPSNNAIFQERVLRYASTLPCPPDHQLIFEYRSLRKKADLSGVDHIPVAEFMVDVAAQSVIEKQLDPTFSTKAPISISPVHEGVRPGSYVALKGS